MHWSLVLLAFCVGFLAGIWVLSAYQRSKQPKKLSRNEILKKCDELLSSKIATQNVYRWDSADILFGPMAICHRIGIRRLGKPHENRDIEITVEGMLNNADYKGSMSYSEEGHQWEGGIVHRLLAAAKLN